jgi:hypothetical protein
MVATAATAASAATLFIAIHAVFFQKRLLEIV